MKFTCIVDACSFINLNHCTIFKDNNVLKLLIKNTEVIFSPTVNSEIKNHYNRSMPHLSARRRYVYRTGKCSQHEFERRVFGAVLRPTERNRGERDNFCLILDQFVHYRKGGLVFLTDDENAIRGVLKDKIDAFPVYHLWCSHDVIIYLYLLKEIPTKEYALDAIREIDNIIAPRNSDTTPEKTQLKLKRFSKYMQNNELIHNVIS